MMQALLKQLANHELLTEQEAKHTLLEIAQGQYTDTEVVAFMTMFLVRPVSLAELKGFRAALLELCIPVDLKGAAVIDLCGTGGDGKNTFNISTLAAFVVAGAGIKVAKHGNYAASSVSGSSDVLAYFGYHFTNDSAKLLHALEKANLCFLHAPLFHPSLKRVAPLRKALKIPTFFNLLGPLVNPAQPQNQLVGVYNLQTAYLYYFLYQDLNRRYTIVHSLDGYDEISLTGHFKILDNHGEKLYHPHDLNQTVLESKAIAGGNSLKTAAKIFESILKNEATESQKQIVLINSAFAIQTVRPELSLEACLTLAQESLESGRALEMFKRLLSLK